MLVVWMDDCIVLVNRGQVDAQTSVPVLEKRSEEWAAAEDLPNSVFLLSHAAYSGRVLSLVQRDEFCARYVDDNSEWALSINH